MIPNYALIADPAIKLILAFFRLVFCQLLQLGNDRGVILARNVIVERFRKVDDFTSS